MLIQEPITFPREANPNWPLPGDYESLSERGQRLARINACCLQGLDPLTAVHAWRFFKWYYLETHPDENFDPMFYRPPFFPDGYIHTAMVHSWERDARSAIACPRGSAKTTTRSSYHIWKLCTHRQIEMNLYKAKEDLGIYDIVTIKNQLDENPRIIDDFGVLKSTKVWSNHILHTISRSWLRMYSVEGRLRGPRADLLCLDDIDYDPRNPGPAKEDDVFNTIRLVCQVILPMLDTGSRASILGTLIGNRSFLSHVVARDADTTDRDSRFADHLWFKANIPVIEVNPSTGLVQNAWESKFTEAIQAERREVMGDEAYALEYEGITTGRRDPILALDVAAHEYEVATREHSQESYWLDPWHFTGDVNFNRAGAGRPVQLTRTSLPWDRFLGSLYRFITVDYAYTTHATSDYSVIHVMGLDSFNDLWSLDLWKGRLGFPSLVGLVWKYALLWRVALVGIEAYPVQEEYYNQMAAFGEQIRDQWGFCPSCIPVRPPANMDKSTKFMRLQSRFVKGKIKLPGQRRTASPYRDLYAQIRDFAGNVERDLRKDDELDTLSMSVDLLKGNRPSVGAAEPTLRTPVEMLRAGEYVYPGTNVPTILGINPQTVPPDVLNELMGGARADSIAEEQANRNWEPDPDPVGAGDTIDPYENESY